MRHVFVFDAKSFTNQQRVMDTILDNIKHFFRTHDSNDFSVHYSHYRRNAMGIIQEEVENGNPSDVIRVYAVGGEEILFDCLNSVVYFSNTQLASVPYGETNVFLNIFGESNLKLFRYIPALVKADVLPTDIIRWGVNYALNSCCTGVNTAIQKRIKDIKFNSKNNKLTLFSKLSCSFKLMQAAFDKQIATREYKISIDDTDYSGRYSLIHVANGPYFDGRKTGALNAMPDDGLLDVALIKSSGPFKTLRSIKKFYRGKKPKNCVLIQAKKIIIQSSKKMWLRLDNEYLQDTGISLNVFHHAISVITVNNLTYQSASNSPRKA